MRPDRKFFAGPESVTFLAPPGPTFCLVLVLLPLAFSVAGEHFVSTPVTFVVVVVVVFHSLLWLCLATRGEMMQSVAF